MNSQGNTTLNPLDTRPGPLDIRFRLFGTPVVVKLWFLAMMALFGYLMQIHEIPKLLVWLLIAFIATMIHELGHIVAGRIFGYPGTIILHAFGGGAVGEYLRAHRWQRIVIAASGPIAGLSLFAVAYVAAPFVIARLAVFRDWQELAFAALCYTAFLTLFSNLSNLPPIMPMDGGMIAKDAVGYLVGRRDYFIGCLISVVAAAAIVGYSLYKRSNPEAPYLAAIFRPLYPSGLRQTGFAMIDPDPIFMAVIYGLMGVKNVFGLFAKAN